MLHGIYSESKSNLIIISSRRSLLLLPAQVCELEAAGGALRGVGPHGELHLAVERLVEALQVVSPAPARTVLLVLQRKVTLKLNQVGYFNLENLPKFGQKHWSMRQLKFFKIPHQIHSVDVDQFLDHAHLAVVRSDVEE